MQKYRGVVYILIIFLLSKFVNPAIGVLAVGLLILNEGLSLVLFLRKIKYKGIRGVGKILSYQTGSFNGNKTPIIEFTPIHGDIVTEKPSAYVSTDLSKFRSYSILIDTEVEVMYDPDDPEKFIIVNEEGVSYIGVILAILAGLFIIGFSVYIFLGYLPMH